MENKDNKPERTAMQELIDWIQENEIRMPNAQRIIAKAIEFRDTVEKEQRKRDLMDGLSHSPYGATQKEVTTRKWLNEKYTNNGK